MKVERGHTNFYRLTLSSHELAAFVSAVRWVSEGAEGELTDDAKDNLKLLLKNYDHSVSKLNENLPRRNLSKES